LAPQWPIRSIAILKYHTNHLKDDHLHNYLIKKLKESLDDLLKLNLFKNAES
jgi:hypothetical protein